MPVCRQARDHNILWSGAFTGHALDGRAALPELREAHPSSPAGRGAVAAVRAAADRSGGSPQRALSLEPAERLLTVVATCRQQSWSLVDFLVAAREAALQGTAVPSLLRAHQVG